MDLTHLSENMHIPKNTMEEKYGNYRHQQITELSIPLCASHLAKKGFVLPWKEEMDEKGCEQWQEQKKVRASRTEQCQGDGNLVSY